MIGRARFVSASGKAARGDGDDDSSDDGDGQSGSNFSDHYGNDHDRPDGSSSAHAEKMDSNDSDGGHFDFDHYPQDGPDHDPGSPAKESKPARQDDRRRLSGDASGASGASYDVGVGFGGALMAGVGMSVGAAAGGAVEISMNEETGVAMQGVVGVFTPVLGLGVVVGKIGPSLEIGGAKKEAVTSTNLCQSQMLVVTPIVTIAFSGDEGIQSLSASFGVSVGLGVFAGFYCGFDLDSPSWNPP
ncbi:hypothetical protein AB4059_13425 [Lysobacter sp. 2RAF19]